MEITNKKYFSEYTNRIGHEIELLISNFDFSDEHVDVAYSTQASAVYSSNIEGNSVDLNSFMNYKLSPEKFKQTKEVEEIENLITAYQFSQENKLSESNFLECHRIFSETLLIKSKRGNYRIEKVGVFGQTGLTYLAIEPEFVRERMKSFFQNMEALLKDKLSLEETFYFASMMHLIFAHIHPFTDGNKRVGLLAADAFLQLNGYELVADNGAAYLLVAAVAAGEGTKQSQNMPETPCFSMIGCAFSWARFQESEKRRFSRSRRVEIAASCGSSAVSAAVRVVPPSAGRMHTPFRTG